MFLNRVGFEFSFTIIAFHHTFFSISRHRLSIKLLDFLIRPLLFSVEQLNLLWCKLWWFSSVFGVYASNELVFLKLVNALGVMYSQTFCSKLSSAYTALIIIYRYIIGFWALHIISSINYPQNHLNLIDMLSFYRILFRGL